MFFDVSPDDVFEQKGSFGKALARQEERFGLNSSVENKIWSSGELLWLKQLLAHMDGICKLIPLRGNNIYIYTLYYVILCIDLWMYENINQIMLMFQIGFWMCNNPVSRYSQDRMQILYPVWKLILLLLCTIYRYKSHKAAHILF